MIVLMKADHPEAGYRQGEWLALPHEDAARLLELGLAHTEQDLAKRRERLAGLIERTRKMESLDRVSKEVEVNRRQHLASLKAKLDALNNRVQFPGMTRFQSGDTLQHRANLLKQSAQTHHEAAGNA